MTKPHVCRPPFPASGRSLTNAALLVLLALGAQGAQADMLIDGTRIVYSEARRDVSLNIRNVDPTGNAMVQLWLDDGDAAAEPEKTSTPFVLTPNVARVGPNGRQTVRLSYTGEPQNPEQESLFWFNMLELPPSFKGSSDADRVVFARRTRIKLFFRPKGLKGEPVQAMKQLQCSPTNAAGTWALECYNPSRFHLSFFGFSLGSGGDKGRANDEGGMLKPLERVRFSIKDYDKLPQPLTTLAVDFVNDYGGAITLESTLKATP